MCQLQIGVEPGKRPRSSMAPTIVLKNGKPYLVIGSPGGSRIIGYVAKAIIAYVDWGMTFNRLSPCRISSTDLAHLILRSGHQSRNDERAAFYRWI